MAGSCSTGHSLAPIFLRVALGITFLWAGFGKILQEMPVKGEAAAALANMGVISGGTKPEPNSIPKVPAPGDVASPPDRSPERPATDKSDPNKPEETKATDKQISHATPALAGSGASILTVARPLLESEHQNTPVTSIYSGADFPNETSVRAVYGIALLVHSSANPAPAANGTSGMPLLPARLGEGRWPVYLAWAAAVAELVGGLFVLVGLMTRFASLNLAVTMAVAMWLTKIGPAIQANDTLLGFLPNHPAFARDAAGNAIHAVLMWQFILLCAALSLVFSGAGALSFDRALLPPLGRREAQAKD